MTPTQQAAMQQALDALERSRHWSPLYRESTGVISAIEALKEALSEPVQEQTLMDKFNAASDRLSFKRGDALVIEQRGGRLYMNNAEIDPGTLEIREDGVTYRSGTLVDVGERAVPVQEPVAWATEIIDALQAQYDTEMIKENDSGDALIRLDDAIAAVEDAEKHYTAPPAQRKPETDSVLYLVNLVDALDNAYISSWQSTHRWQQQLDNARDYLAAHGITGENT